MNDVVVEMTSTASIAIAVFGIALCLTQKSYTRVSTSFAVFLAAIAVDNFPAAFGRFFATVDDRYVQLADLILWIPVSLSVAPLFWIYVVTLTSTNQRRPARLYRHFVLPGCAVVLGLLATVAVPNVEAVLAEDAVLPGAWWIIAFVGLVVLLQLAQFVQIAVYLCLVVRRLTRHRLVLRDYYASTERHELRWIYVIGGLGALYWLAGAILVFLVLEADDAGTTSPFFSVALIVNLALISAMTFWGLRQRPPLMPDPSDLPPPPNLQAAFSEHGGEKYEKSALSPEASARIARKIRTALEDAHLYRDPNLSLWMLAKHTGASPNYVSQTLSEVIGESFFDVVNGYRVAEAMKLLATTDETVLAITYDVGFNARSTFYKAFKRVTGQTPSGYRKALSQPVGTDDSDMGLSEI